MAKILTERAVAAAKPQAKRYGRACGIVPGLQLVVQPTGAKAYRLLARVKGKQQNLTIGNADVISLAKAREEAKRQLGLISSGSDPRKLKQEAVQAEADTVASVAALFLERHARVRHKDGGEEAQWRLSREILPRWGTRPIGSITRRDVVTLLDGIVDRGVAVTANRTLAVGRRMFNFAIERSILEVNPFDHVKPPAAEVKRDRVLSDAELKLIWQASASLGFPFGPFTQLLILLGQRREEIAGLRWSEFDAGLTVWTLPRERAKNNVEHVVALAPWARKIIGELPRFAGSDLVFTTTGATPISGFSRAKATLDTAIAELNGGVPIAPWRLHDARRTFASNLARLGVQLPVVEKILNHVSGSFSGVQGIYQRHDFADEKRHALEAWALHLKTVVA
jgi:integrase